MKAMRTIVTLLALLGMAAGPYPLPKQLGQTAYNAPSGGASGVSSFNTRTGAVTLTSGDVTTALTFTPAQAGHTHPYTDVLSVPTGTILYRKTAGTGAAETQTLATLKTDLGLTGTNSGDQSITAKDEGTTLTSAMTTINFVGAGVSATNSSGVVTVTISGETSTALFSNVVLLADFDGTDAATAYTDESSFARVGTFSGNAQLDNGITPAIGSAALLLDGTGDFVSFASSTSLSVANSEDQTIEGFFRCTNVAGGGTKINTIMSKRLASGASEFAIYITSASKLNLQAFSSGTSIVNLISTTSIANNTWYYYAMVRKFGKWTMFLGAPGGTANIEASAEESAQPTSNTQALTIGRDPFDTTRDFTGTIDVHRWTRRQALYTGAFLVPSVTFPRS